MKKLFLGLIFLLPAYNFAQALPGAPPTPLTTYEVRIEEVPIPSGYLTLIKETQDAKDAELQFQARWQDMLRRQYHGPSN